MSVELRPGDWIQGYDTGDRPQRRENDYQQF